jgi:hypothetical protein
MSTDPLAHLAQRLSREPDFLAYALHQIATRRGWTDTDLAGALGCTIKTLTHLRICTLRRSSTDVVRIAEHCGCSPQALAELLAER